MSKYDELIPALDHFSRSIQPLFYLYLKNIGVGTDIDNNLEVGITGEDINGDTVSFYATVTNTTLMFSDRVELFDGVKVATITGSDGKERHKGVPVKGNQAVLGGRFIQAIQTLVQDIELWSSKYGMPVEHLSFVPLFSSMEPTYFESVTEDPNGQGYNLKYSAYDSSVHISRILERMGSRNLERVA